MADELHPLVDTAEGGPTQPAVTERPLTVRGRLRQIIAVLVRNGFALELVRFGLESLLPFHRNILRDAVGREGAMRPVQLRVALEQLGTTAIKLGQILSTRADLLPPAYVAELAKLRDQVPAVPAAAIEEEIARELGSPVDRIFARFDQTPLAAASIGQVHSARLPSGEEVIVKVRKPGVAEQVEIDLRLLLDLARLAERHSAQARQYGVVALAEEFAYTLRDELDYEREGNNADTFRRQFGENPDIVIPAVYWPLTTARVLTEARLTGIAIDDVEELRRRGIDLKALAARSAELILTEVFEHGFYHADPHPGNFVVLDGGAIGAMDFGMVGRLSRGLRGELLELLDAVVAEDAARTVDGFEALGIVGIEAARESLIRDVGHLFGRFLGRPLADVRIADFAESIFGLTRRYRLRMPAELALLLKTLAMNEGVGRQLDPEFNVTAVAAPFVRRQMRQRIRPSFWEPALRRGLLDLARVGVELPGDLRRMTRRVERGEFTVVTRLDGYEAPLHRLEAMVNRLAISLLVSALVLGTSLAVVFSDPDEHSVWFNGLLAAGLLVTLSLGIWLVIAIWRSGRR
jgi:ubiquinone biosynthesis protein